MYPKQTDLPKGLLSSLPKTPLYQGETQVNEEGRSSLSTPTLDEGSSYLFGG